jgi:hypothetical protein
MPIDGTRGYARSDFLSARSAQVRNRQTLKVETAVIDISDFSISERIGSRECNFHDVGVMVAL